MKTIRFTAFSILFGLLVLVSACKKENKPAAAPQTGSKIMITGQDAAAGLKSTINGQTTVWVASSDIVGIYSADARTTSGGVTPIVNAPFTAAASAATSSFTGTMYWGAVSASHTFYAYYPYTAGSAASTAVPVSLASAQTQSGANNSDHIGALDFMVATPAIVISPANTNAVANEVNLSYNHLFTILEFQIKGTPGTQLKAVKLAGSNPVAFSGGTIDITQSTPATGVAYNFVTQTGTTTQAVVTLTSAATLTATNTDTKVYMVINPGTQTGNCVIGLSTDGTTWKYITKTALTGGFLRGNKYVVSVDAAAAADPVDGDGNTYATVLIGTQVWMAKNLNTTKYNDGTPIPNVTDITAWAGLTSGAYCYYNNNVGTDYGAIYGALYNWYAVDNNASTKSASNGGENICPVGWHIPSDADWDILNTYLGGSDVAGGKLKESGTDHWRSPNAYATNIFGFTALPGGCRGDSNGYFGGFGEYGYWWSSSDLTSDVPLFAWYRGLHYMLNDLMRPNRYKYYGMSVRCVKN